MIFYKVNLRRFDTTIFYEMDSQLLPRVFLLLEEEFLLEKDAIKVSQKYTKNSSLRVTLHTHCDKFVCTWIEHMGRTGGYFFAVGDFDDVDEAVKEVRRQCFQCDEIRRSLVKKHKEILEDKNKLLLEIERLRRKKREIKYAPGRKGALKAEDHFVQMTRDLENDA